MKQLLSIILAAILFTPALLVAPAVGPEWVQVSAWAVSRDGVGPRFTAEVNLDANDQFSSLAYGGFPTLPECFPQQAQHGPPACPAEWAEDFPSLRDNWFSLKVNDLNEPIYFGLPFTIMWVEVCADRQIDPASIWMFMVDRVGTHSTFFRTADHIDLTSQYTDDQWFMHKDGKGFTVPVIIVGIQLIGLFVDREIEVGFDYMGAAVEAID